MVQASGTGNFASAATGGYNRDASEDRAYVSGWSFVDSPSASATFQFQWRRDTDTPTGGTVRSFIQAIPFYYSDIGIYTSTSTTATGGTTPTQIGGFSAVVEGTNITIASNQVSVTGDNTRYLCLGAAYHQSAGNARTQRWYGFEIDGTFDDAAKGCMYYRNAANADGGQPFIRLLETDTATRTIELNQYRGDGVAAGQGGADVDGNTTGANSQHAMVVIELNSSAEVFSSTDATGGQEFALTGPVDVDIASTSDIEFNDSASFTRVSDTAVNCEQAMDVFAFANVSHAREAGSIGSGSRWTVFGEFTINGTENTDVGFHGNYNRGNQGTQDCHGSSTNQAGVFAVSLNDDIGISNTELPGTEGGGGDIETQAGWVGFGLINIDTLEDAGGGGAIQGATSFAFSEAVQARGTGDLATAVSVDFSESVDLSGFYTKGSWQGSQVAPYILPIVPYTFSVSAGGVSASTSIAFSQSADLNAVGDLAGATSLAFSESADLNGTGSLSAGIAQTLISFLQISVPISSRVAIFGSESVDFTETANLAASGTLSATESVDLSQAGSVQAVGALQAATSIDFSQFGSLSAGAIVGSATLSFSTLAELAATGELQGAASVDFSASATAALDNALRGDTSIDFSQSAITQATGSLIAAASLSFSESGIVSSPGDLSASTSLAFTTSASPSGDGRLLGLSLITFSESADLGGAGVPFAGYGLAPWILPTAAYSFEAKQAALQGDESVAFSVSATLTGSGIPSGDRIQGSTSLDLFGFAVYLEGRGQLQGSTSLDFSDQAVLNATLFGNESISFSVNATLSADGRLLAAETIAFSELAGLSQTADLSAQAEIAFSQNASLTMFGRVQASETLAFSQSGILRGIGSLSASESVSFSQSATGAILGTLRASTVIRFINPGSLLRQIEGSAAINFTHSATLTPITRGRVYATVVWQSDAQAGVTFESSTNAIVQWQTDANAGVRFSPEQQQIVIFQNDAQAGVKFRGR